MTSDIPQRLTGALSGRYFLERELGQGWNATVYLAEDVRAGGAVTMKVIRPELSLMLDPALFLEALAPIMALDHPGVLPVIDAGNSDGVLFCVAPYTPGESLRERLTRDQRLDVDQAVPVARAVAEAVHEGHSRTVVHGGLKPENVLFATDGVLVTDFGFEGAIKKAGRGHLAPRDLLPRRPHYLSPERARFADADIRSDVYALGCLLYEMVTAVPPVDGSSAEEVVQNIIDREPERMERLRPDLPAVLVTAVHKALSRDPRERFDSAAAFAAALP